MLEWDTSGTDEAGGEGPLWEYIRALRRVGYGRWAVGGANKEAGLVGKMGRGLHGWAGEGVGPAHGVGRGLSVRLRRGLSEARGRGQVRGAGLWAGHGGSGPGRRAGPPGPGPGPGAFRGRRGLGSCRAMASSERSALLTYRLCGGSVEEERGRERARGRAAAAAPRKLPTFLGVVVPTLLSMFSVVLFLRLGECCCPPGRLRPPSRPRPGDPRDSPALPGTPVFSRGLPASGAPSVWSSCAHPEPFRLKPRCSPPRPLSLSSQCSSLSSPSLGSQCPLPTLPLWSPSAPLQCSPQPEALVPSQCSRQVPQSGVPVPSQMSLSAVCPLLTPPPWGPRAPAVPAGWECS